MTDPNGQKPPCMTWHAVLRFQERVEALPSEEIEEWATRVWKNRRNSADYKNPVQIKKRKFRGKMGTYLVCRSPGRKPAILVLSEDLDAVLTVLDARQWSRFMGTKVTQQQHQIDMVMEKVIAMDRSQTKA